MFGLRSLRLFGSRERPQRCRELCIVLDGIFIRVQPLIRVGTSTAEIDRTATEAIAECGCEALFKSNPKNRYPSTITASVNEQVVNNTPSSRRLRLGDLLSLQIGIRQRGVFAYQSWTFAVEEPSQHDAQLWQAGFDALNNAICNVRAGSKVRDVSTAIQSTLEARGFSPGRDYVGHGIGDELHVEPVIPCFVGRGRAQAQSIEERFVENQLLSINVFAHAGSHRTKLEPDQWGVVSCDNSRSVHFSHILVVESAGCTVLTSRRQMEASQIG